MGSTLHATAHGLAIGDPFYIANVEPTDAGVDGGTIYYVATANFGVNAFEFEEYTGEPPALTAVTLAHAITYADLVAPDTYAVAADGIMDPPDPIPTPSLPTLTSATVSGIVRLKAALNDTAEAKVRLWEVQVTSKFTGADADWTTPQTFSLPDGSLELSMPALGSTIYAVRLRAQDVYGNYSAYCGECTVTTAAGSDALNAALADLANDVQDGIITATKIADNAISTPKLQAGAVTAEVLAATIVLASLLKTADTGRRIELDIEGIRLIDTDESLLVRIPTNGDPVYVKGEVSADSLVSQTAAEFRGTASLAGNAVMTLQNGIAAPSVAPSLTASVDSLALTSTPGSIAAARGIAYDSVAGTFWIACDPTVSPYYVAQEFNATTGALVRSISSTGSITTTTTTLGSTSHVADSANGQVGATSSHIAVPLVMPRDGRITKVAAYLAGRLGTCTARTAIWTDVSGGGNAVGYSAEFTAISGGATTLGASVLCDKTLSSGYGYAAASGSTIYAGWYKTVDLEGHQFDMDDGAGKTTYGGNGPTSDGTGWGTYDSAGKPNVYITYEYDTDTRLETAPNIGIATDGTYIYTLDNLGKVWKYLRSTGAYFAVSGVQTAITGTKTKAGLFWDATASELIITTTTGTGAVAYPKFVRVNEDTLAVSTSVYSAGAGSTFSGTTATFSGGARLADPLNASTATYWVATTSLVYAYTFSGTTATQTSNRHFGQSTTVGDGLTHDGTVFRGWDSASPTKVWKFSAWDFTTTYPLWVAYSWYDSAGTTHETAMGPRASLTVRRRERVQVQNAAIPTGGVDDPNAARIYALQNATDTGAGTHWLQVTDALTARYVVTYTGSGTNDGAGTAFAAGTAAALTDAGGKWSLKGDGTVTFATTVTPGGKPPITTVYPGVGTTGQTYATWTKPAGLVGILIELQGGGGGGGGTATTVAGEQAQGGSGGGGAYVRKWLPVASLAAATYTVRSGGGGAAGAASAGATAGTGGQSDFGSSGSVPTGGALTAAGGTGGIGMAGSSGTTTANGGNGGAASSNGDLYLTGGDGMSGRTLAGSIAFPHLSAISKLSQSQRQGFTAAGAVGPSYGGGGLSATTPASTGARTGGAGGIGVVIITEYFGA